MSPTSPAPPSPAAPAWATGRVSISCPPARTARSAPSRSRAAPAWGPVSLSENEWSRACNLREGYWLYVVFGCAGPRPRLVRVQDPFGKLLARTTAGVAIAAADIQAAAED